MKLHPDCYSTYFIAIVLVIVLVFHEQTNALVLPSKSFKVVNRGKLASYVAEYNSNYRVLPLSAAPFLLGFYNTTPNAFTLAIGLGMTKSNSGIKWVWDANRGRPVKENAVLSFGQDGNLVLADADGSIAWQSGTANKGVAGISLLSYGNLVLVDGKNKTVWQSFDFPRDTVIPGQTLRYQGPKTLTSRVSEKDGSNGPYSFQLEQAHWTLFYTVKGKRLGYYKSEEFATSGFLANFTFGVSETNAYFDYSLIGSPSTGSRYYGQLRFPTPYAIFRMEWDGNVRVYTYLDTKVKQWENVLEIFDRFTECDLPARCGSFGLCSEDQCVGCPRPEGLTGWSKTCAPPPTPPCNGGRASGTYYEVVGVDHFLSGYNDGIRRVSLGACRGRCDKDCECLGYFYNKNTSSCILAPVLGTLRELSDSDHVGYIKTV